MVLLLIKHKSRNHFVLTFLNRHHTVLYRVVEYNKREWWRKLAEEKCERLTDFEWMTLTCDVSTRASEGWDDGEGKTRKKKRNCEMIYKGRCKAMKSWKFSRCVSWARHLSFPKLASAAYPCFQHFMCISNEPAISSWVSCIAWKMKNVSSCAYEMCSVPVMWWELDMWKKKEKGKNKLRRWKVFFPFQEIFPRLPFFSLSWSAAVVVLLRKWNLVELETWWVDIKGKKEKEKMKETITQHMEKHKWIIVVSSLLGWLWPFLLLLLLALPKKKREETHTRKKDWDEKNEKWEQKKKK